ncbi:OmpA family protein [Massilia haematophila]|uniref:OmpA family protein n=1 Tax=Massilia haematophila TaxID=457923 RepID=A0ABV7PIY7_9BURK
MKTTPLRLLPLLVTLCLPLAACKKEAAATQATTAPASVDTSSRGTHAATDPAAAAGNPGATTGSAPAPAEQAFDFGSVPEASGAIAPFPYVDYPSTLPAGNRATRDVPLDSVLVILGKRLHPVEGRVATRTFDHMHAKMSALEVRRNYENAMRELGAVKVNSVAPDEPSLIPDAERRKVQREKMWIPDIGMSYDVYLVRKGDTRHWIVVMSNRDTTRLLAIEEKPFIQTIGYVGASGATTPVSASGAPPAAPQPVDVNALAVTTATLPPFPYLDYPPGLHETSRKTSHVNFDAVGIIVGKELRMVEGEVETRSFANSAADMSELALRRNYEAAIKGLGGVKVNAVSHDDPAFLAANTSAGMKASTLRDEKLRVPNFLMSYDSYLVRTPEANVWLVLMFGDGKTRLLAVREKAMNQSVSLVTADTMRKELADKGKVALYINFDTDKADIRDDARPAVEEIATLLKNDSGLKLAIEGHTDDSGNAARNQVLSRQRAEAVVQYLVKGGIDAGRLRAAGHGAARPLADNKDEAGRAKNRRVELIKI